MVMAGDKPEYVSTDEGRATDGLPQLQRRLDLQDGAKSRWERKRTASVVPCNGDDPEPQIITEEPKVIGGEVIDGECKED